jgi:type II secretory pathway component PulM
MKDRKAVSQLLAIGKQTFILLGIVALVVLVLFAWIFWTPNTSDSFALQRQEEKIRDLEDRLARLEQQSEESSKRITPSQTVLNETIIGDRAAQGKANSSRRDESNLTGRNRLPELYFY